MLGWTAGGKIAKPLHINEDWNWKSVYFCECTNSNALNIPMALNLMSEKAIFKERERSNRI